MSDFACVRCQRTDREPLGKRPFQDDRGTRIAREVCGPCWEDWKRRQMLLINHYGLNVRDAKAREFLLKQLDGYLFEGADGDPDIDTSMEGSVSW